MSDVPNFPMFAPPGRGLTSLLAAAVDRTVPVVRGIADEDLGRPTPCQDYDVRELVNHLFHVVVEFQALAAKGSADFSAIPDRVGSHEDWRERFAREAELLVAAWAAPGAEDGTTGTMEMPARTVGAMALLDLAVHGWDLARATEQSYVPDPSGLGVVPRLREEVKGLAPTARSAGAFGAPVSPAATATEWDRLLAETGREPHWTRPGN